MSNDLGWALSVDAKTGDYRITTQAPSWTVGGTVGTSLNDPTTTEASDSAGAYREIRFHYHEETNRTASIRLYRSRPVAIFSVTFDEAVDRSPAPFPVLTKLPDDLLEFRYGETDHLRPLSFHLAGKDSTEQYGGPFALFDTHANALILSPAANFMCAMMSGDQQSGLKSGLNRTLASVPAGYTHQTILAIGPGINHTWDAWGNALTDLYGKKRPANDGDAGLKYIGYWTDNGGFYYYNYDIDRGYDGTLLAVKKHLDAIGVPIGYMQLDSWFYPKTFKSLQNQESNKPRSKDPRIPAGSWNRYGGLLEYTAHPDLFPQGLAAFDKTLGVPLVTHNRWIDPESPYHRDYKISGVAGVDPKYWDKIIGGIGTGGVKTYEQDWLNYIYNDSPELSTTTSAGDAFMDDMASACAAHGLTMQYCMVLPRHLMQGGAKYPNLTTVRVSGDRLDRGKWREFVYGSRLASALGVWPWTDVSRSKETGNILLSTLSGSMVGLADEIGQEDTTNIFQVIRKDGVIVKPDVPLTPTDATVISESQGKHVPIVCATHAGDAACVFAFSSKTSDPKQTWTVDLKSIGIDGAAFAYDFFNTNGHRVDRKLSEELGNDGWSYWTISPIGPSKMALIGDVDKFIPTGKQRIAEVKDDGQSLDVAVAFAANERDVTLALYAPAAPVASTGEVAYDSKTQIARVKIHTDKGQPLTHVRFQLK